MFQDREKISNDICSCLNDIGFSFKIEEDGEFYVSDHLECPVWIEALDDNFVKIFSYINFVDGMEVDPVRANALANDMNAKLMPNCVYARDGRLWFTYYMSVLGGLSSENFIKMLHCCAGSFRYACDHFNDENLLD